THWRPAARDFAGRPVQRSAVFSLHKRDWIEPVVPRVARALAACHAAIPQEISARPIVGVVLVLLVGNGKAKDTVGTSRNIGVPIVGAVRDARGVLLYVDHMHGAFHLTDPDFVRARKRPTILHLADIIPEVEPQAIVAAMTTVVCRAHCSRPSVIVSLDVRGYAVDHDGQRRSGS